MGRLFSRIYEDSVAGKLSDERYARMASVYETEQKELMEKVKVEEKLLSEMEQIRSALQPLKQLTA